MSVAQLPDQTSLLQLAKSNVKTKVLGIFTFLSGQGETNAVGSSVNTPVFLSTKAALKKYKLSTQPVLNVNAFRGAITRFYETGVDQFGFLNNLFQGQEDVSSARNDGKWVI